MKKILFVLVAAALFVGQAAASPVSVDQAYRIGLKYVQANASKQVSNLSLAYTQVTETGMDALYVFNFEEGFIIVAADDVAQPILAFGEEGPFDANNIADGLAYYLRHYARQIAYAVENHLEPEAEVKEQWARVEKEGFAYVAERGQRDVTPLLSTTWNQDYPYNYYCPTGQGGPGGRAYAGCVATAMSMVMKYWNWPAQGTGSHSYTPSGYPEQSVDFGATTYDWDHMTNSISSSSPMVNIQAIATLMYHCGVAVDMMYGAGSSGAYSQDVPSAIAQYFSYTDQAVRLDRDLYSRFDWEEMLIRNLEEGFPLYYSGADAGGGHAFACDGYRASDRKFHFNWGWSGYGNNSYYAIDALNVMGSQLNDNQAAIFDFIPDYVYNGLIPAVENLSIESENANSKKGIVTWTNPVVSMDGTALENIDQVVLLRNGEQIFSQNNVVPGEAMSFEDNVNDFDSYSYRLYFVSNGQKGRFADASFQYGPTCTWKIIGQTSNFQGWNGGKVQVLNSFGTIIDEVVMTSSSPISQQLRMPQGAVSFRWVAPATPVNSMTINIKNSSNSSVYTFNGNSNQIPATLYSGDNDCGGCQPPTALVGQYQWHDEEFGTMLTWSYDEDPQSFKVYRSTDGRTYEAIATVDKAEREYFDAVEAGSYYYKVTAFRSYCESTPAWTEEGEDCVFIEVTSVGEISEKSQVYPNPANQSLCVTGDGLRQVVIYNMTGQMVFSKACDEDGIVINTSSFAPGVYAVTIKSDSKGTVVKRFSVAH